MLINSAVTNRGSVYDRLFKHFGLSNAFTKRFPEMAMPMLQRYYPEAMKKIYSLSGFRDMSGSHIVMQAALKILQQPRHLGIGLCFEEAEVIPDLAQQTIRLCERIGYYGAFELEFIVAKDGMLLIDFNGRFYNQLAFDIARGMDLPRMVYAGATGATEELERLVSRVPPPDKEQSLVFCNGFGLSLSVAGQQVFKRCPERRPLTGVSGENVRGPRRGCDSRFRRSAARGLRHCLPRRPVHAVSAEIPRGHGIQANAYLAAVSAGCGVL